MANTNIKYGSSGSDVKKLQNALSAAGYDVGKTGADGVFGKNTAAAVKQYQKDNGLAVDGIAGKNTLGALYGNTGNATAATGALVGAQMATGNKPATKQKAKTTPAKSSASAGKKNEPATASSKAEVAPTMGNALEAVSNDGFSYGDFTYGDFNYDSYVPSETVNQANAILNQHSAGKPGPYQSQWQTQIDDYGNQIANRDPFSYDPNSDALYNMYKDLYVQQGRMAMMDTMGQAAAMTGGYGNSYAQTVGQQVYNQNLNQLNEVLPELQQMAYGRYQDEGQNLMNLYNMYMDRENQDYGRYQNDLGNWYNDLEYLTGRYDSERNFDYNQYSTDRGLAYDQYSTDKNLAYDAYSSDREMAFNEYQSTIDREYQAKRDAIADERWQMSYDEDLRRYEQDRADKAAAATAKSYSGGGGGSTEKAVSYKSLEPGSAAYNDISKNIERATTSDALNDLYEHYVALGYDPAVIGQMVRTRDKALNPMDGSIDTDVDLDDPPMIPEPALPLYNTGPGAYLPKPTYNDKNAPSKILQKR